MHAYYSYAFVQNLQHYSLQCLMLMEILFDVDGLSHLKMSVLVCAKLSQLHLTRLVCVWLWKRDTHKFAFPEWCRWAWPCLHDNVSARLRFRRANIALVWLARPSLNAHGRKARKGRDGLAYIAISSHLPCVAPGQRNAWIRLLWILLPRNRGNSIHCS